MAACVAAVQNQFVDTELCAAPESCSFSLLTVSNALVQEKQELFHVFSLTHVGF